MATHTDISRIFIDRPILATVLSTLILVSGLMAIPILPISEYPDVVPPSVQVTANYPGANPRTIADTVAGTDRGSGQRRREHDLHEVDVECRRADGAHRDVQGRHQHRPRRSVQVQNRVAQAVPRLPEDVRALGVTTVKSLARPDDGRAPRLARQDATTRSTSRNFANLQRASDELARLPGVGQALAVRHRQLRDARLARSREASRRAGLSASDIVAAIREQNVRSPPAASAARRRRRARCCRFRSTRRAASLAGGVRRDHHQGRRRGGVDPPEGRRAHRARRQQLRDPLAAQQRGRGGDARSSRRPAPTRSPLSTAIRDRMKDLARQLPGGRALVGRLRPDRVRARLDRRGRRDAARGDRCSSCSSSIAVPADLARLDHPAGRRAGLASSARSPCCGCSASRSTR